MHFHFLCGVYPTDIYNIYKLGLYNYAIQWFVPSGRTVGIIALSIFDKLGFGIEAYTCIMKLIAIIIATYTILLFIDLIDNQFDKKDRWSKIGIFISTFCIFLNCSTYQFFYYTESAIMWLGVLFTVLAVKQSIDYDNKFRLLKSFILLFLGMNCYQVCILIYLPLTIIFTMSHFNNYKERIMEVIKNALIVVLNLLMGLVIVEILIKCFNVSAYKFDGLIFNIRTVIKNLILILFTYSDGIYNLWIICGLLVCIEVISVIGKDFLNTDKKMIILMMLLVDIISIIEVVLILSLTDFYHGDRIQFAYIASLGINLLIITLFLKPDNVLYKIVCVIGCGIVVFNIINSYDISRWSRVSRSNDVKKIETIIGMMNEYEKENNLTVNKIEYCKDSKYTFSDKDVRHTIESTRNIIGADWVLNNAINYYSNRDLKMEENTEIYKTVFLNKNWDSFSKEQIVFNGTTMYICMY